ncbi:MAG: cytochrome c [Terracidiphilus sp.]
MTKTIRTLAVLAAAVCMTGAMSFAQDGAATYKAKCQMCHGATGTPSAGMAKAMGIKAVSDPDMKKLTEAEMIAAVKDGKGKMKPIAGLTEPQVKEVVTYFRSLK